MRKYIHKNTSIAYGGKFKKELDRRYADYKNGTAEIVTAEESKRRIEDFLKSFSDKLPPKTTKFDTFKGT